MGAVGSEQLQNLLGKPAKSEEGGAKSGALLPISELPPDLRRIFDAWEKVPTAIRQGILAMIDAVLPKPMP